MSCDSQWWCRNTALSPAFQLLLLLLGVMRISALTGACRRATLQGFLLSGRPDALPCRRMRPRLLSHQTLQRPEQVLFPTCFEMELPSGYCLGVQLPSGLDDLPAPLESLLHAQNGGGEVHPGELAFVSGIVNVQGKLSFLGGRAALRRIFAKLYGNDSNRFMEAAMLRNPSGAPDLPAGISASISHKDQIAVGLVRRRDHSDRESHVGVDIELCEKKSHKMSIASRILTEAEGASLGSLTGVGVSPESEVLLHFSLKEGLYKAIHPFVKRYVGFKEAEVLPRADGTCGFKLHLKNGEGPFAAKGTWCKVQEGKYFLTSVMVTKVEGGGGGGHDTT